MQVRGALGTARATYAAKDFGPEDLLAAFAGFVASITSVSEFNLFLGRCELEEEIGDLETDFATWLPMSILLDAGQRSRELSGSIRNELAKIREHSTYALDLTQRHPGFPADQNIALPVGARFSKSADDCALAPGSEVTLNIPPDGAELAWAYDPGIFDEDTVLTIAQQFDHFLRHLSENPEKPIEKISLLDDYEWQQAIEKWNDTTTEFPGVLMHAPFEAHLWRIECASGSRRQ
jgi:non-ribosomal peptide synthetase component F